MSISRSPFPVLGILGGGQLARMTAYAAFQLGMHVHVMERFPDSPAGSIAHREVIGGPEDHDLLREFALRCDVVTLESEFVNEEHLKVVEDAGIPLYPRSRSVARIQDKLIQKRTLEDAGIPVAAFRGVGSPDEAARFGEELGFPFVLKSRRGGYDGYGNATIRRAAEIEEAWSGITRSAMRNELYCEAFVAFEKELAVMVARGRSGETKLYPVVETIQRDHICHVVKAPALVAESVREKARDLAQRSIEAIDGIGIFGVELFATAEGEVLVNELAPRPHNSGHYTIEGCVTSQFENHIRAIMDWPLGATDLRAPGVAMANILGREEATGAVATYDRVLRIPNAHLHIYGKLSSRAGRKMGHVTVLSESVGEAERLAREAEAAVEFVKREKLDVKS